MGGSIGTVGIQLGKLYGAEVTAVDSGPKLDMMRDLGADHVIDYTKEDFSKRGETYDVIFDVIGKGSFGRGMRVLKPNGRYLMANPKLGPLFRGMWISRTSNKRVISAMSGRESGHLNHLKELIEAGKLKTIIDRAYPLEQTAEAHQYVETGQKRGNVVIVVTPHD